MRDTPRNPQRSHARRTGWPAVLTSLLGLSFLLAGLPKAGVSQPSPLTEAMAYLK